MLYERYARRDTAGRYQPPPPPCERGLLVSCLQLLDPPPGVGVQNHLIELSTTLSVPCHTGKMLACTILT